MVSDAIRLHPRMYATVNATVGAIRVGEMSQLTNERIKQLKPTGQDYRVRDKAGKDSGYHGFGIKVTAVGKRSFFLEYRLNDKRRFLNLGHYPARSLKEARTDAKKARSLVQEGIDPQLERRKMAVEQKRQRQSIEAAEKATTVNQLLDFYIYQHLSNIDTQKEAADRLGRDVRPRIGQMKVKDVTDRDIRPILLAMIQRGVTSSARKVHSFLHAAFNLSKNDYCDFFGEWEINPVSKVSKPEDALPDKTTLSKKGIVDLWCTLDSYTEMSDGLKDALRVLLLTGQRVQEVLGMRWTELDMDEGLWTVPPERLKAGKKRRMAHVLPVTPMVREIIGRQPRVVGSDQVFPGRDDAERPLEWRSLGKAVRRLVSRTGIEKFTPRTLRGTVKTNLARLKVMREVRNRIQNHALTGVDDLHYDAYDYLAEKRSGLLTWERELIRIVGLTDRAGALRVVKI